MASQPASAASKPSFAKVAASKYVPTATNHASLSTSTHSKPLEATPAQDVPKTAVQTESATPSIAQRPRDGRVPVAIPLKIAGQDKAVPKSDANVKADVSREPSGSTNDAGSSVDGAVKPPGADDSTQVSSSDGSAKQPAFDSKSLASVTTFAMDEKESLRPDDSASLRAVEDEDQFSVPGTGAAESKIGSDADARAFSDQLREISVMATRAPPGQEFQQPLGITTETTFEENGSDLATRTQNLMIQGGPMVYRPGVIPLPDDKLMEALASHRDRLFVLKLEQDIIDFITNSDDMRFELPQTNAFYRMLAHKLADYYQLLHSVVQNVSGSAVVLEKTTISGHLPTPLSSLPNPTLAISTPPLAATARKIMRRGADGNPVSGTSTSINSEGPSKTTSEVGDNSEPSEVGQILTNGSKSKSSLTREEREAKYKEARERIFGNMPENDSKAGETPDDDNDLSRTSSTTGKKKQPRKQKTPINDDFEPRSQFPTSYSTQPYAPNGYNADSAYGVQFPNITPGHTYSEYQPMQGMYPGGIFVPMIPIGPQMQHPAQSPQLGTMGPGVYPPNSSDLTAQFHRAMQGYQNTGPLAQPSSQMMYHPHGNFQTQIPMPMQQQGGPSWQQPNFPQTYGYNPGGMPSTSPHTNTMQAVPYGYSPQNAAGYLQPSATNGQGSYPRGAFNPQSQSFVPNGRSGPQANGYPRQQQYNGASTSNQGSSMSRSTPPYNSPRMPPNGTYASSPGSHTVMTPASLPQSLPQPPNPDSSIAKWGTPSHLPPKPPPPASMEPQQYNELHRGLQGFPGLPRISGGGSYPTQNGSTASPASKGAAS